MRFIMRDSECLNFFNVVRKVGTGFHPAVRSLNVFDCKYLVLVKRNLNLVESPRRAKKLDNESQKFSVFGIFC
jgi:hypothetical protein